MALRFKTWHLLTLTALCAAVLAVIIASGVLGPSDEELNIRIYTSLEKRVDFRAGNAGKMKP